jgi:hypothetical protein
VRSDYLSLYLETEDEELLYEESQQRRHIIQARIYNKEPELFPVLLRRAAWLGMFLTLLTALILAICLDTIVKHIAFSFFPLWLQGLNQALGRYLLWLSDQRKWLQYIDGCLLGSGFVLLLLTRNLQRGNEGQQWLAFFQAIGGVGNAILLLIPMVMYLPNLLLWLLALIVILAALTLLICFLRAIFF